MDRESVIICRGVEIALGKTDPGIGYFRNITDGEGQAILEMGKHRLKVANNG